MVASGNLIHVHSCSEQFPRLSTLGSQGGNAHTAAITGLLNSPINAHQIISCSADGTLKFWDWVEGRLARTIAAGDACKILHMCLGEVDGKKYGFCVVQIEADIKEKQARE